MATRVDGREQKRAEACVCGASGQSGSMRKITPWLTGWLLLAGALRADRVDDLVRLHLAAMGGPEKVQALRALRSTGITQAQGRQLQFVFWAARPNLVRIEQSAEGRTLTEGYDGKGNPWVLDMKTQEVLALGSEAGRAFIADAEFDDPLVAGKERHFTIDFEGEMEANGHRTIRLLITQNLAGTCHLVLDGSTYLILRKESTRAGMLGEEKVETVYSDYRLVAGVIVPYHITELVGGKVQHEITMESVEANPTLPPDIFSPPLKPGKALPPVSGPAKED